MALIEELSPDFMFSDSRGTLVQISHNPFAQVNAVFTKKGAVRGRWHYHRFCKEYFYVIGGQVRVQAASGEKTEEKIFSAGAMFMISENVRHNFEYLQDTYLVVLYNKRVELESGEKDIVCDM